MSGEIVGCVWNGVEADTGLFPAPDIDLTRYTPPGIVIYGGEWPLPSEMPDFPDVEFAMISVDLEPMPEGPQGNQIWPPQIVGSGDHPYSNPLWVDIQVPLQRESVEVLDDMPDMDSPLYAALPDWFFPDNVADHGLAALTLEIGPRNVPPVPPTPTPIDPASQIINPLKTFRAYYELLDNIRVVIFEPATPTEFFAYHPLTETDMTAFDGIGLDVGAYEFIEENINLNQGSPYLGIEGDDDDKKKKAL